MTEGEIYDSFTDQDRLNCVKKFRKDVDGNIILDFRKVFVGQPITVEFKMKNVLGTDVNIQGLKLVGEGVEFKCYQLDVAFAGAKEVKIMLTIIPLVPGKIKITQIQWTLFDKFKCNFVFSDIEKLVDCSKIFQY